jgi:hypothetical protein
MGVGLAERQALAAKFGTDALYGFVATGDPGSGTTVANEASGGSPAYVRKPLTWSAPDANGQITASATFDVAAGTYTFAGLSSAVSGATQLASTATAAKTYGGQALHTVTFTLRVN